MADVKVDAEEAVESSRIISVLAETNRRDRWTVPPRTAMITFLARSFFDFRKAEAAGNTVVLDITCVFGKVTLVVPEGTDVELSGFSFLASATSDVASSDESTSHLPKLVIVAHTVFGRICVRTPNDAELGIIPATGAAAIAEVPSAWTDATDASSGATAAPVATAGFSTRESRDLPAEPSPGQPAREPQPVGSAV